MDRPGVGVGIIIENDRREVLIGRRIGSHAHQHNSIPGGWIEPGESIEEAAYREGRQELGISISDTEVIGLTNNLGTYHREGVHSLSVVVLAKAYEGEPRILEHDRFAELFWCDPAAVPEPHFDASRLALRGFLSGKFYVGISRQPVRVGIDDLSPASLRFQSPDDNP